MNTKIVPVAVYPSVANTLTIRSITLGPPPSYFYQLENVEVVPGTPAVGVEGEEGYVPATPDTTTVTVLKNGNVSMTIDQWDNWAAGPETEDEPYQLDCIAANLGLTRA
jgi:hypothetical protein